LHRDPHCYGHSLFGILKALTFIPMSDTALLFPLTKGLAHDDGRGEGVGFRFLLLKVWADNHLGYWFNTVLLKARNVVLSPDGYLSTPVTMGRAAARWAFTARMSHIVVLPSGVRPLGVFKDK
jgi:hypothetical protein